MKWFAIGVGLALTLPAVAPAGDGARFGARDPHVCGSTKASGNGPPSAAVAREAFLCATEQVSASTLYLAENVKIEVAAKGSPYNPNLHNMSKVDVDVPMYAVRGSYTRYQCSAVSDYMKNAGKNCNVYQQPEASGICYKTTFGDWKCSLLDLNHNKQEPNMAPPAGK